MGYLSEAKFMLEQDHQRFLGETERSYDPFVDCGATHPRYDAVTCVRTGGLCTNSHLGIVRDPHTGRGAWIQWNVSPTDDKETP